MLQRLSCYVSLLAVRIVVLFACMARTNLRKLSICQLVLRLLVRVLTVGNYNIMSTESGSKLPGRCDLD